MARCSPALGRAALWVPLLGMESHPSKRSPACVRFIPSIYSNSSSLRLQRPRETVLGHANRNDASPDAGRAKNRKFASLVSLLRTQRNGWLRGVVLPQGPGIIPSPCRRPWVGLRFPATVSIARSAKLRRMHAALFLCEHDVCSVRMSIGPSVTLVNIPQQGGGEWA